MAIFGKTKRPDTEPRTPPPRGPAAPAGTLSIIGAGMTVRGDLEANGVVKVEGTVEGNVRAASQVLVAKGGSVQGDVETTEAVVGGTVSGAIHARNRVEIQAGASVHGDITTRRIAVAEGGSLNGLIRMDEAAAAGEEAGAEAGQRANAPASPPQSSSAQMARAAAQLHAAPQPT